MEKVVLWGDGIEQDFVEVSENQFDDFLELVRYIQKNNIQNVICENTLYKAELWEWLYSKDQVELNDIKRELRRYIEKARYVNEAEFDKLMEKIGKLLSIKVLALLFDKKNIFYISTILEYYAGIRSYLKMEKKDDFCKDLQECFPNIYFAEGIETSVNSLNRKFEDIREEIVEHLTQINDFKARFGELLEEHKSYQEIAREFTADTGIECSPQAGREKVQDLKERQFNDINGQEETVICELHTKFKKFNIDRERQDRIYFFPGKKGILNGKIIVKYIGTHL